jgi:transcriptional regulator with XRE-family HTH domain
MRKYMIQIAKIKKKWRCQQFNYDVHETPEMRTDSPRYAENQLKKLRRAAELSQDELARLIGLSVDFIRSFEVARRGKGVLSNDRLTRISKTMGAEWDPKSKQWNFWPFAGSLNRLSPVPYHKTHLQGYQNEQRREADERELLIYRMLFKLAALMREIPAYQLNGFFWRLEDRFNHWESEFGLDIKAFDPAAMFLDPLMNEQVTEIKGFRKIFPNLFKGEDKELLDLITTARKEHEALLRDYMGRLTRVAQVSNARNEASAIAAERSAAQRRKQKALRSRRVLAEESKNIS